MILNFHSSENIEVWANIPNHKDYQISNCGRVKSYKNGRETILKGFIQNTGYLTVHLDNKKYSVHRLVASVFIHELKDKDIVNHKDGNKLNNHVDNLEWCTYKENNMHAWETGLMENSRIANSLLRQRAKNIGQYTLDGKFIKIFKGSVEAEKELNSIGIKVNARNIRSVCEGKRNKAGGFKWKYM